MNFSVIMPAHNAERYIEAALHSARDQTLAPHEIIVINDRSTDGTQQKIKASGVDVVYLESDFGNAAAARNAAVQRATGDWLAFLDADDIWYLNHLQEAAGLLRGTDDVGYFSLLDTYFHETGDLKHHHNYWPLTPPASALSHQDYMRCWLTKFFFHMITTVVRADRFREVGGFNPEQRRRHDFEMWLRVIHEHTWSYNNAVTARYSGDTPGSISREDWASSEWYQFRGLLMNLQRYKDCGMPVLLQRVGRRMTAAAFTDGTAEDRAKARELAWTHLHPRDRAVFTAAGFAPRGFRTLNKLKRRVMMR